MSCHNVTGKEMQEFCDSPQFPFWPALSTLLFLLLLLSVSDNNAFYAELEEYWELEKENSDQYAIVARECPNLDVNYYSTDWFGDRIHGGATKWKLEVKPK